MNKSTVTNIYGLQDIDGVIRYVGKANSLKQRLNSHQRITSKRLKSWAVAIKLLQVVPFSQYDRAERLWIKFLQGCGHVLENRTSGGGSKYIFTPEVRIRLSLIQRTPEWKAKISDANKRRIKNGFVQKHSPETRAKIALKSKHANDERIAKGLYRTDEYRMKQRLSHLGKHAWNKGLKIGSWGRHTPEAIEKIRQATIERYRKERSE